MRQKSDRFYAVHFFDNDEHSKLVDQKIEEKMNHHKMDFKFDQVKIDSYGAFANKLLKYINENDKLSFDFLVIGSNGFSNEKISSDNLGSTASLILQKAMINIILV